MRLDKYLTQMSVGSRSQVKEIIKKGHVKVNDVILKKPELHIDEMTDKIEVNGNCLEYHRFYYYMLNKPAGVVSAVSDKGCKTVLDLLDVSPKNGLFPVGRLDKDTEGLLLITNDGMLAHQLLSPSKHIEKTYYVKLNGKLVPSDIDKFKAGLDIGEKHKTKPAKLEILEESQCCRVTITEGKYHQVKRMFVAIGLTVTYLKRLSMGPLMLDDNLMLGEFRKLTDREIEQLKACNPL